MNKTIYALLFLILASLACMEQIITPTPDDTPAAATRAPLDTPTATATAEVTPMIPVIVQTAIVRQPLVNIHETAGGPVVADVWLVAGQEVTILGYDETGDWVHIQEPEGWIWAGCLEGVSDLGCEAK